MKYKPLRDYMISNLCFGTSTFVEGRLNPYRDSETGKNSLRQAIVSGVNFIHSNPNLETQWAVREVLTEFPNAQIAHLIKVESPLKKDYTSFKDVFTGRIKNSLDSLSAKKIAGIIYEKDKKRTSKEQLADNGLIFENYAMAREIFETFRKEGKADLLFSFVDNPEDMERTISSGYFDGLAAYFNLFDIWPAEYFDSLYNKSLDFLAIRPLRYGIFVGNKISQDKNLQGYKKSLLDTMGSNFREYTNQLINPKNSCSNLQSLSIKFVLAHPVVKTAIVGTAKREHFDELAEAAEKPIDYTSYLQFLENIKSVRSSI